jgi:hypothetical protein
LLNDFDLGYHLRGGQWMLQNHQFFTHDVYTYTVSDHPYLDIHWLYQIGLYLVYLAGGYSLLSILNIVLLVLVFLSTFQRLRQTGAPLWMGVILLGTAILACETRFDVRPEIVSWLLLSLTLWVLEARSRQNHNLIYWLPLIQLVWVNIEGLFPLGLILMGAYVLDNLIRSPQKDIQLCAYSFLSLAVCFLNPNGIQGVLFPLVHLQTIGTLNSFKQAIGEFQPSWAAGTAVFMPFVPLLIYKFFSFFLLFLLLATFKQRKVHEILIALSFFYLSVTATRNISLFMLVAIPIAAACWKDLQWEPLRRFQKSILAGPITAWFFTFMVLIFCVRVLTNGYYISDRRGDWVGLGLDKERVPVQATEFLVDNHLDGPILNQLNWGGWLDWKGPQKTFIDGRLEVMGESFYAEYLTSYRGGLNTLTQKYGTDIIFFAPSLSNWQLELAHMPDWRLVYRDEYFVIYLKNSYALQIPVIG